MCETLSVVARGDAEGEMTLVRTSVSDLVFLAALAAIAGCGGTIETPGVVGDGPADAGPDVARPDAAVGDQKRYTVGGVVHGLSIPAPDAGAPRAALSLRNAGGAPLLVEANGAFTFPDPLAEGSAYSVTVASDPEGHRCLVNRGKGVITAAVVDVDVACEPRAVALSVEVRGLARTGLVLQNLGANPLVVDADGTFRFPAPVLYGAPFSVTVRAQPPARPRQLCKVGTGGSGWLTGDTVVTVDCGDGVMTEAAHAADRTFSTPATTAMPQSGAVLGLAFDGLSYIEPRVVATLSLARYDTSLAFVRSNDAAPAIARPRSLFVIAGVSYVKIAGSADVAQVDGTGVVTPGFTLATNTCGFNSPLVYDAQGAMLLCRYRDVLHRWDAATRAALPDVVLAGYGSVMGEGSSLEFATDESLTAGGGYALTIAGTKLSAWDATTGARVKTTTLTAAGTGAFPGQFQDVTFSFAADRVWIRDLSGPWQTASWRGYDVGL